jgi:hypothetical protein
VSVRLHEIVAAFTHRPVADPCKPALAANLVLPHSTESRNLIMKPLFGILLVAAACAASPALAQQVNVKEATMAASSPGRGEVARALRASATVTAIDKATRTVTLKGADGKEFPVVAGPDVRRFDQIKVGDEVVVGYLQALALELKKGGGAPVVKAESSEAARAASGAQPGGVVARKVTVMADVVAVDAKTQTVTLRGPQRTVDLSVPDPKQFKMIAVGDQIQATFTEAVAISLEPAPKKK